MLTTEQASNVLGLTPSTFKRRASQFGIGNTLKRNKAYWPDDALQAMRLANELLAAGKGNDTIKRKLNQVQTENEQDASYSQNTPSNNPSLNPDQMIGIIRTELTLQNDLAEKYARATYRIGELEAKEQMHLAKIAELQEQVKLLQAPKQEHPAGFMAWLKRIFG